MTHLETWQPLFDTIAADALQRELDHELPFEQVDWLKRAGFGALRVPVEHGGAGLTWPELADLWIALAAADNNLPQAFRGHFALAEDRLWHHRRGHDQRVWFERFVAGEIAGNAWSEVGPTPIDSQRTVLTALPGDQGYRLDGTKYYTTGSIFAEWADVYARLERPHRPEEGVDDFVIAIVDTRAAGVSVVDDWDGFGQRGTGSGTTSFEGVLVPSEHVLAFEDRFPHQTAVYQLNLLATLSGIAQSALREVVAAVRVRERNYSHANAARVRDDPQVLSRIGEISSAAYVARSATLQVAQAIERVAELATAGSDAVARANEAAEIEASQAQVVVTSLVLQATSDLFDTLGASATSRLRGLDRHWRNARTVSSHNPRILKARVVGEHEVNGTPPPYAWAIGATRRDRVS
ncbi:MAG: monooxygenase [Actinobacteria bacterium]|uniref:Dibenzothiophene monooxygenase n=1 Tax=freshwater metagenome TaxID=449393 RepID=A0A6J6PSP6_9ZZZZ|nr:monooxygenase [Actinomycetota bacterium]